MSSKAICVYCSCACNKTRNALDWGSNNIICYCACNAVHLYTYERKRGGSHLQTLVGHKSLVTSVHWIIKSGNNPEDELISTSADKTSIIWTKKKSEFFMSCALVGHSSIVRNAYGIYLPEKEGLDLLIATVSIDSTVKIWHRSDSNAVNCIQTISFGNGFGLDVKLAVLNDSNDIVMAIGGDDAKIQLYVQDEQKQFVKVLSLSGHEDWIQSIDIVKQDKTLLLASASQDCHIRVWKIYLASPEACSDKDESTLKVDESVFKTLMGYKYAVSLESILSGHENWIYSVRWQHYKSDNGNSSALQILSASMDKTMIIWEHDYISGIWMEKVRVGEVGGNTQGFYGGVFSPCGLIIIAHGYQGAIHVWQLDEDQDKWEPGLSFGGHYSSVQDIDWDPEGEYLISCSSDQTTRLHAPYVRIDSKTEWFEIGRPQVHGYDMVCLCVLSRFSFVSAGDEKVLRVFEAPRNFAETLSNLSKVDTLSYVKNKLAEGASVPSLGLSNKAVFLEDLEKKLPENDFSDKHPKDRYPDFYYTPNFLAEPPTEETLLQNTLWPEVQKLYGHPYEVYAVACNHSKTIIASACKGSKMEHAGILLWSTTTWRQIGQLLFHSLTITQLEFSPDDKYLLSVSRDRMWAIYRHFPDETMPYRKVSNLDKKSGVHSRIIWSCSWTFDSLFFATASRDKKVAVWGQDSEASVDGFSLCSQVLTVDDSATAVSFAPCLTNNSRYILAIGLENGCILLSTWCKVLGFNVHEKLNTDIAHHLSINRLKFAPCSGEAGNKLKNSNVVQLASCGNDHHTKIYNVLIDLFS